MKNKEIKIINEKGEEVTCKVKTVIFGEENDLVYFIFEDGLKGEDGIPIEYAAAYHLNGDDEELLPIETEEEWDLINSIYEAQQEKDIKDEDYLLLFLFFVQL